MTTEQKKKFIINFAFTACVIIILYFCLKYLMGWLLPFVIAFIIAYLLQRPINYKFSKYLRFIPIVLLIILIIILLPRLNGLEVSDILEYSPESPLLAALILLGIYCLKSIAMFIPLAVLYISTGIMFPAGWAIALTYFCLFCEMSIGYFIGKHMGGEKINALMEKNNRARQLLSYHKANNTTVCFITRILPLPFDLLNMFFGATGTGYPQFIAFSLLGVTPGMIPYVLMGNAASNPLSKEFLVPFAVCGIITVCTFVFYQRWRRRKI